MLCRPLTPCEVLLDSIQTIRYDAQPCPYVPFSLLLLLQVPAREPDHSQQGDQQGRYPEPQHILPDRHLRVDGAISAAGDRTTVLVPDASYRDFNRVVQREMQTAQEDAMRCGVVDRGDSRMRLPGRVLDDIVLYSLCILRVHLCGEIHLQAGGSGSTLHHTRNDAASGCVGNRLRRRRGSG